MKRAFAFLLVSGTAYAGGTVRPDGGISARGIGMGGAWAAWADDPTAVYFNPAALDATPSQVMVGSELVVGPRSFTPLNPDGTSGDAQKTTILSPVPALGAVGRLSSDDEPSRFTLGLGVWNTFGGSTTYTKTGMPAIDAAQDLCLEADGALAYHVSDRLSVGANVRVGVGIFKIESTANPYDANISASGVGGAMGIGALFRPTDSVRIGLNWRSPMRIGLQGKGSIETTPGATPMREVVEHDQTWPQQVQLGVGVAATESVKLAFQLDWSEWSQMHTLEVRFPSGALPNQIYPEYWKDNWTVRVGGEYAVSRVISLRAGGFYDTEAVPDQSIERQYTDTNKIGVALGAGLRVDDWRIDLAADGLIPNHRKVPDNSMDVIGLPALQNKAPGDYMGSLVTFELAVARQF